MRELKDYQDEFGFIGHRDSRRPNGLEFGDGTQRLGTWYVAQYLKHPQNDSLHIENSKKLAEQLRLITRWTLQKKQTELTPQWVRHWDERFWEGQLWIGSRDNFEPIFRAAIIYSKYNYEVLAFAELMLKELKKRKGLLWNYKHIWPKPEYEPKLPDFILYWDLKAMELRFKKPWYRHFFLWFLDLDTLINSIIRVVKSRIDQHSTSDDLNHQLRLAFQQGIDWTFTAFLARLIYRLRGRSGPRGGKKLNGPGTWTAWLHYYNETRDPPMPYVWRGVWEKFIK